GQPRLQDLVPLLQCRQPRAQRLDVRAGRHAARLEAAQPEPALFLREVDGADVTFLERADLATERRRHRQPALDLRPRRRAARDDGAGLSELGDAADEQPPLTALDHRDVGRALPSHDGGLVHPDEVGAVQIAVGDLDLLAPDVALARDPLAIGDRAGQHLAVGEREPHHLGGPEEAGGIADDDRDEADHHDERGGERAAGQPDEGLAAPPEAAHQRYRYFRRSRRRTISATVLRAKVRQKSRKAARNSTRNRVPPSGASGSSTAMLAESARKPLKIFQSITGVL